MDRTQSSLSVGSALKKVESYQYPATHLGHLSPEQNDALQSFKTLSEQKGYFRPETSRGKASHDDETMLRYLRARKFQPTDAFGQFKDTEDWRRVNKIDNLYDTIDISEYDETRRLYPQWTGRRDRRGIPVYTFEVAPLNSKRMAAYEKSASKSTLKSTPKSGDTSPKLLRLFALYENLLNFTFPLCSGIPDRPYAETPVSQSNNIVDIAGVGLKQFWNLRQHMQDASQLATAHYPETLDRIFVIGAPSFFPTVWSWVKGWFDPITVSKIFILSKQNMKSVLETYIDPANIPKKYGGTLDWEWGDLPSLEPPIASAVQWENPGTDSEGRKVFPPGPIRWRKDESGNMEAVAVGSENRKQRDMIVARLPVTNDSSLGPVASRLAVENTVFGQPSTTGVHTHPSEGDYFPPTGVTPPDEHDDNSLQNALDSHQNQSGAGASKDVDPVPQGQAAPLEQTAPVVHDGPWMGTGAGAGAGGGMAAMTAADAPPRTSSASEQPRSNDTRAATTNANIPETSPGSDQYRSIDPNAATRAGTSTTRYEAQAGTRADGQLADATPDKVDRGYGDKPVIIEPSTVGQAHKNVDVPEAEPPKEEEQQPGYLEQAQTAAAGAAATVSAAGSAALAKVGLGGDAEGTEAPASEETTSGEQQLPTREKKEDPRIDKLEDRNVEDFIRSKYATGGKKR